MSFVSNSVRLFAASVACFSFVIVASKADASPEKISIVLETKIDPETGRTVNHVENPSGTADLTFIKGGVKLTYLNEKNQTQSLEIFAQYSYEAPAPTENVAQNLFNDVMGKLIVDAGATLPGILLRGVAAQTAQNGSALALRFDRTGKAGFIVSEYALKDVTLLGTGSEPLTLESAIYQLLAAQAKKQVEAVLVRQNAIAGLGAPEVAKNPIGFLWDQTGQTRTAPTTRGLGAPSVVSCESLFR